MKRSDFYVSTLGHRFLLGSDLPLAEWGPLRDLLNPRLACCCSLNEANAVLDQFFKVIEPPEVTEVTLMLPVTFYIQGDNVRVKSAAHSDYDEFFGSTFTSDRLGAIYREVQEAGCRNAKDALRYLATRPERSCTSPATRSE